MSEKRNTKGKIIQAAARLFRQQGYHATGLNQIIQESGCPKGSLYHYFPNGKEELATEAVRVTREKATISMEEVLAPYSDPVEAFQTFFNGLQEYINNYDNERDEGAPIGLLALETSGISEPLRNVFNQTYEEWKKIFERKMVECGVGDEQAQNISVMIIALVEGGVTLSVVNKTSQPFVAIAKQIPSLFIDQ